MNSEIIQINYKMYAASGVGTPINKSIRKDEISKRIENLEKEITKQSKVIGSIDKNGNLFKTTTAYISTCKSELNVLQKLFTTTSTSFNLFSSSSSSSSDSSLSSSLVSQTPPVTNSPASLTPIEEETPSEVTSEEEEEEEEEELKRRTDSDSDLEDTVEPQLMERQVATTSTSDTTSALKSLSPDPTPDSAAPPLVVTPNVPKPWYKRLAGAFLKCFVGCFCIIANLLCCCMPFLCIEGKGTGFGDN